MADATQVQRRRGTEAQCNAMTPADGEIIVDQTNDTLRVGDGSRQGGFIMPNAFNIQQSKFTFAVAAGTANAITLDIPYLPSVLAQPFTCRFKASLTNSGDMTASIGTLGPFNIRKVSEGAIVALTGGEVISGCFYDLVYDGSDLLLMNVAASSTRMVVYPPSSFSSGSATLSIPSWAKRVSIKYSGNISSPQVQCILNSDTSSNYRNTGYSIAYSPLSVSANVTASGGGFIVWGGSSAASQYDGYILLEKLSDSSNDWSIESQFSCSTGSGGLRGRKSLSSSLSSVRITDFFTMTGTVNMIVEG